MSPAITELIMIFDLLRNFLFDSDEVKVLLQLLVLAAFAEDVVKRGL